MYLLNILPGEENKPHSCLQRNLLCKLILLRCSGRPGSLGSRYPPAQRSESSGRRGLRDPPATERPCRGRWAAQGPGLPPPGISGPSHLGGPTQLSHEALTVKPATYPPAELSWTLKGASLAIVSSCRGEVLPPPPLMRTEPGTRAGHPGPAYPS